MMCAKDPTLDVVVENFLNCLISFVIRSNVETLLNTWPELFIQSVQYTLRQRWRLLQEGDNVFPLKRELPVEVAANRWLEVFEKWLDSLECSDAHLVEILVAAIVQLINELLDKRMQGILAFILFDEFFKLLFGWRRCDACKNLALVLYFLFLVRLKFWNWLRRRL